MNDFAFSQVDKGADWKITCFIRYEEADCTVSAKKSADPELFWRILVKWLHRNNIEWWLNISMYLILYAIME